MLEGMRQLALDYLFTELGKGEPPTDLSAWFRGMRANHPEHLFPYLVEDIGRVKELYTLVPDASDDQILNLTLREVTEDLMLALPFMRPSGSQGAQVGPVFKRTYSKQKGGGPQKKIIKTTIASFTEIASAGQKWSPYFREILEILSRPRLRLPDQGTINWGEPYTSSLDAAIDLIGEKKGTVFLAVADHEQKLPGQHHEYLSYLMEEKLAGDRYVTGSAPAQPHTTCPLCGTADTTVYPNGVKGAGINFGNMDRDGAFTGVSTANAWKGYSPCLDCSDLLYVYKFHTLKPNPLSNQRPFMAPVAGDSALIVPHTTAIAAGRQKLMKSARNYARLAPETVAEEEIDLIDMLIEQKSLLSFTFLWTDVRQNIENLRGVITDVPPSRLAELSKINEESRDWSHPVFPEVALQNLKPNLSLTALKSLFWRPGGKKVQDINKGRRMFQLRRQIAAAVYQSRRLPEERFWQEVLLTARSYVMEAIERGNIYGLLHEGVDKTDNYYLTAAGWVRHLARWLHYFRRLEVLPMTDSPYQPTLAELKPFFGAESGIDSVPKAYAFLLGVLYGKLLQVQGARGVNVGANALTWLKRLTLTGKDLPEFYVKTREKLLAYETEKNKKVRLLLEEIGELGVRLGSDIDMDDATTCYFLLLGQSLSNRILTKQEEGEKNE